MLSVAAGVHMGVTFQPMSRRPLHLGMLIVAHLMPHRGWQRGERCFFLSMVAPSVPLGWDAQHVCCVFMQVSFFSAVSFVE